MKPAGFAVLLAALAACHKDDPLPTGPAATTGRLAFMTNRNDGQYDIYLMNPNGTGVAQLTSGTADDVWPAWSPDGRRIAFYANRRSFFADTTPNYNLWITNADGSGSATLLFGDTADDIQPAWSPDGGKIAFASDRDSGDFEIYVMNADGSNQVRLTFARGQDGEPAWSPDGSTIAFASTRDAPDDSIAEIYAMKAADGSGVVNLTHAAGDDLDPAWSPDGTKIAFASDRSGLYEVWVMDADGGNPVQLTHNPAPAAAPAWSPDGTRIAYESDSNVWIMYADGSAPTRVTHKLYNDGRPRWKP